jgi:tellurite resistance protein
MRTYPRNSPEAAARVVALVLISDGNASKSEFEVLNGVGGVRELGLDPRDMPSIVQTLCEDMLMEGFDGRSILSRVGDELMASLMAEVDNPLLQTQVLRIARSVIHADGHLSDAESAMVDAISRHWRVLPLRECGKTASSVYQHV